MTTQEALRVRRMREQLAAVGQYVSDLEAPIREELRSAPELIREELSELLDLLDNLDRNLAKIDSESGAVGGRIVLREEASA